MIIIHLFSKNIQIMFLTILSRKVIKATFKGHVLYPFEYRYRTPTHYRSRLKRIRISYSPVPQLFYCCNTIAALNVSKYCPVQYRYRTAYEYRKFKMFLKENNVNINVKCFLLILYRNLIVF